ncbi:MAG: hypothetical protein ACREIS_13470 [Nitrospiraceae bacterium]
MTDNTAEIINVAKVRPRIRTTYTYAIMVLSPAAYREVRQNLVDAGYDHSIQEGSEGEVLDMHGIALMESEEEDDGGA